MCHNRCLPLLEKCSCVCVWVVGVARLSTAVSYLKKTGKHNKNESFTFPTRVPTFLTPVFLFLFLLLYLIISCASLPTLSFLFIPTGIRAANSCQTHALIQSASRLSPRPSLILSINNPADGSLFFSNKEMDYTARLKANKLPSLRLPLADSHWPPNEWMRRICHRCLR